MNKIRIKHGTLRKSLEFELVCEIVNIVNILGYIREFCIFFGIASERIPARIVLGQIHLGRQVKQREATCRREMSSNVKMFGQATAIPTHCYDMGMWMYLV